MKTVRLLLMAGICITSPMAAIDNHHFYRTSYFFGEPRLEKDWLSTFEISIAGGDAHNGFNADRERVPTFDIYGFHNMRLLGSGLPNKDATNPLDLTLINLENLPANNCFGKFSIGGHFGIFETYFNVFQNFQRGFFVQLNLPLRYFNITPLHFCDLSPSSSTAAPNIASPEWQNFLAQFDGILTRYNLSLKRIRKTGLGDFTGQVGWTYNFQDTKVLDFVDVTIKAGFLAPTDITRNENLVFDLSTGYDGHWGVPVSLDAAYGLYEWFTMGVHAGVLAFVSRHKCIRMKTDLNQSGLIYLAKGNANVSPGAIWDVGTYVKTDHAFNALSFILGYTFAYKDADTICPHACCPPSDFDPIIVNSDERFKEWYMNTLHLLIEYDFTTECMRYGPRLGFLFNAYLGGKRTFKTPMIGGYVGLDIAWEL